MLFQTEQLSIHYRWAGQAQGPVLVLSHSLGTSSELWTPQLERLGLTFRLLLYDHRGHGQSGLPAGERWSIEDFACDLLALLDALGLERVGFCGLSLGGMVGLWLAQQHPDRLEWLVAANTAAYTEDPSLLEGRMEQIRQWGLESIADNVVERWFTAQFRASEGTTVDRFREMLCATPREAYLATSAAVCELDLRTGLSGIDLPTLVITGNADRATPPAWGQAIAQAVPLAGYRELPAAHLSNVEAAEAFTDTVLEIGLWVESVKAATRTPG